MSAKLNARAMAKHLKDLESPDDSVRRNAAQALSDADERAIYPLIKALSDESYGVQDAAIQSLVSIGSEVVAYMVVPLLREESLLRNTALLILKELGRVAVPLLYPLLKDKDSDVRKFALDILGEIRDDVIPEKVVPLMEDTNANVRAAAVKAVGELMFKEVVSEVIKALRDEEWVAFSALEALGRLREETSVDPIAELLSSDSMPLRQAALETLGLIGSPRAADAILRHIAGAPAKEKSAAIKSLVQIGVTPSMSGVSDVLIEMFTNGEDWDERLIALRGLVELRECRAVGTIVDVGGSLDRSVPEDEERLLIIEGCLEELGCPEEYVKVLENPLGRFRGKVIAAEMLGRLKYEKAVPVLIKLLEKSLQDVRRACMGTLGKMDSPEIRKALLASLDDHDSGIRKGASAALGRLREKGAFERILRRLDVEKYDDVIEEDVRALLMIDPEGLFSHLDGASVKVKESIGRYSGDLDILLTLSRHKDADIALAAISSLGGMDEERAVERLKEALSDKNPLIRRAAVKALGAAGACHGEIVAMLADPDVWVRLHAVRALGESRREETLEPLGKIFEGDEVTVSLAAIEAIELIGGKAAMEMLKSLVTHRNWAIREAAGRALDRS